MHEKKVSVVFCLKRESWKWTTHKFLRTSVNITTSHHLLSLFRGHFSRHNDNNINALVHIYNVTRAFVTTHALMRLACFNRVRCEKWSHSWSAARSTRVIIFHISTWLKLASLSALWFTKSLLAIGRKQPRRPTPTILYLGTPPMPALPRNQ